MTSPSDLLTLAAAARIAGVNPASLRHAIHDGRLDAIKPGNEWLVTRAEIERYITERRPHYRRGGTTLLASDRLPNHWIVDHDGEFWLVPNVAGGWAQRTPYRGPRQGLTPVDEATSRLMRDTCGVPA